ncbi:MAG: ABC transporter permease [Lachnospiraceae bacterium]|nr:ABC transporter permease [Lachnospiraceae bacterium]
MNSVLNKRILRDLKSNFGRYAALMLMIILGIYLVVSIVGSSELVLIGTEEAKSKNMVEDGQFSVFIPLTDSEIDRLSDKGTVIEKIFSFNADSSNGSVLRVFKTREKIDLITLDDGRLPNAQYTENESEGIISDNYEAVIEKNHASVNNIRIGDTIPVSGVNVKIVGIGSVPDYDAALKTFASPAVDSEKFGVIFVSADTYEYIRSISDKTESYTYAFRLGEESADDLKEKIKALDFDYEKVEDEYFRETIGEALDKKKEFNDAIEKLSDGTEKVKNGAEKMKNGLVAFGMDDGGLYDGTVELDDGMKEFKTETEKLIDEVFEVKLDNLTEFVKADENIRIAAAAGDVIMDKRVGLVAGIIVLILFAYVISVFIVHQIEGEQSVIGALYSMGVKKKDLLRHYVTLSTIISFLAGGIGCILAFTPIGIPMMAQSTYDYFSIPEFDMVHPEYLILYGLVLPPVISLVVNLITINGKLSRTALSLLRNEQKSGKLKAYNLKIKSFTKLFAVRQLLRESRSAIIILIGMLITLMVIVLGINTYVLCSNVRDDNVRDTKYEYMYLLKYPMKTDDIPKEAESTYLKSLSIDCEGYNQDVSVIGIDGSSRYFDADPEKGKNKAVINTSLVQRYGYKVGDKITLEDKTMDLNYTFTITGISDYSVGFTVFMDIDSMRELFGEDEDYINVLYSDEKLDIEEGRLYSVTTKEDIEHSSAVFLDIMMSLTVTLISAGIVICCVVMYLMMAVMIDRSAMGISLIKIFGYRSNEVRKLYLNGNTAIVVIGGIITIPLAKLIIDSIYPSFIANVACSMNLHYPWMLYGGIYIGLLAIYFAVNALLLRKINRITPAEVLKDRE